MLANALIVATVLLSAAMILCGYRLWRGPDPWDRILALDTLSITAIALLIVQNIRFDTDLYFDVALLIAALGFIGSVTLAQYVTHERDNRF